MPNRISDHWQQTNLIMNEGPHDHSEGIHVYCVCVVRLPLVRTEWERAHVSREAGASSMNVTSKKWMVVNTQRREKTFRSSGGA